MNLNKQINHSHEITAAPFAKPRQTYFMNEHTFGYNPKNQGEGNYKQEVEKKLTVKHVYKKIQQDKMAQKLSNVKSKHLMVWENEQDLEKIHEIIKTEKSTTSRVLSPPSIGFTLSSRYT